MIFGPVPVHDAAGAILAHSVVAGGTRLRKGRSLTPEDCALLAQAGVVDVTVARLSAQDVTEDDAATAIGIALEGGNMTRSAAFTGRVNLHASCDGVMMVNADLVNALNAVSPDITLATLNTATRVTARQLLATVKIIPYGVDRADLGRAVAALDGPALTLHPFCISSATVILTELPGMKPSLLQKGESAVRQRLAALGVGDVTVVTVPHETCALAEAVEAAQGRMVLILTASATSDSHDVGPEAVRLAGGRVERFGMPVDPGNLLFLGQIKDRPVIGLPGCARAPALNGADWVLERIAAELPVTGADIAAMGVGGLLKEIPTRPQARGAPQPIGRPHVSALILAAGASRRMGQGRDKLLEDVEGQPLLARTLAQAQASGADAVYVTLPSDKPDRAQIVDHSEGVSVLVPNAAEGMSASIRAGIAALPDHTDAVLLILADMPEVTGADMAKLIAAFDPTEARDIIRATTQNGTPGHPVIFGRRFFEPLARLTGDRGAREVMMAAQDYIVDVPTTGAAALTDLDTPEAWADWRART